jgi:hypothetical protein
VTVIIPARTDPRWQDPNWRTETLRDLAQAHGLTNESLAELTGHSPRTAKFWRNNSRQAIPAPVLRLLAIDLNAQVL